MKLLLKFNLVFIAVFLPAGAAGLVTRELLARNAQEEMLQHARFLMEKALAVRAYTSTQVAPLLETQMKYGSCRSRCRRSRPPRCSAKLQQGIPTTATRKRRSTRPTRATARSNGRPT